MNLRPGPVCLIRKRFARLAERYGQTFVMDWVPELEQRYGVSVLHSGGTDYRSEANQ